MSSKTLTVLRALNLIAMVVVIFFLLVVMLAAPPFVLSNVFGIPVVNWTYWFVGLIVMAIVTFGLRWLFKTLAIINLTLRLMQRRRFG